MHDACRYAEQAAESAERVRSGPLGLVCERAASAALTEHVHDTVPVSPVRPMPVAKALRRPIWP